ncbi:hypothetical protein X915_gp046 [Bacillus phage vB_BanS-Tsamsa]|uniref:Uncharacterized protein n=1 Tax=Bacillus phage vB_BanS-Tsamsa TaxID=1308863 RepID=U5JA88_9CAUD|nr:hypothetical protein X915_gp046 [Bacillus phage vB_BanS-Tsamsa]AGI11954.1 hypothetical protein [Bacillus phage vB_BanS-Tsamsa]
MVITISGIDKFTHDSFFYFTVDVDLMKDDFQLHHEENCVKVYINDDYYVSSKEDFELSR